MCHLFHLFIRVLVFELLGRCGAAIQSGCQGPTRTRWPGCCFFKLIVGLLHSDEIGMLFSAFKVIILCGSKYAVDAAGFIRSKDAVEFAVRLSRESIVDIKGRLRSKGSSNLSSVIRVCRTYGRRGPTRRFPQITGSIVSLAHVVVFDRQVKAEGRDGIVVVAGWFFSVVHLHVSRGSSRDTESVNQKSKSAGKEIVVRGLHHVVCCCCCCYSIGYRNLKLCAELLVRTSTNSERIIV
jgi:hypothetical protein